MAACGLKLSLALPTGYATSFQQASNEVMEEIVESRQDSLALMTNSEGKRYLMKIISL
jgi:hypothetical protein